VLKDAEATAFLVAHGVLSEDELQARFVIGAERYLKAVDIEAATLADIATTRVLPAVEAQLATSGQAAKVADKAGLDEMPHLRGRLARLASLADALAGAADALEHAREGLFEGHDADRGLAHATAAVLPALAELRSRCDEAEGLVTTSLWPMPTYWDRVTIESPKKGPPGGGPFFFLAVQNPRRPRSTRRARRLVLPTKRGRDFR
jgi:glutamine synthetase